MDTCYFTPIQISHLRFSEKDLLEQEKKQRGDRNEPGAYFNHCSNIQRRKVFKKMSR